MNVTVRRRADYEAPNHFEMSCVRLQGREAGPAEEQLWLGVDVAPAGTQGSTARRWKSTTSCWTARRAHQRVDGRSDRAVLVL